MAIERVRVCVCALPVFSFTCLPRWLWPCQRTNASACECVSDGIQFYSMLMACDLCAPRQVVDGAQENHNCGSFIFHFGRMETAFYSLHVVSTHTKKISEICTLTAIQQHATRYSIVVSYFKELLMLLPLLLLLLLLLCAFYFFCSFCFTLFLLLSWA